MRKLIIILTTLLFSYVSYGQLPTKEKANEALLALGIQTLDYPLNEIYQNLTQDEANMLNGLKSNYMINFKKVSNYYYVEKSINLDDFITYVDQRNRRYMIALAIAQPLEVLNIRYHPSKRGVFLLKCSFKVTHISRVVGFRNRYEKNEVYGIELEFEETSEGLSYVRNGLNSHMISDADLSRYGRENKYSN